MCRAKSVGPVLVSSHKLPTRPVKTLLGRPTRWHPGGGGRALTEGAPVNTYSRPRHRFGRKRGSGKIQRVLATTGGSTTGALRESLIEASMNGRDAPGLFGILCGVGANSGLGTIAVTDGDDFVGDAFSEIGAYRLPFSNTHLSATPLSATPLKRWRCLGAGAFLLLSREQRTTAAPRRTAPYKRGQCDKRFRQA